MRKTLLIWLRRIVLTILGIALPLILWRWWGLHSAHQQGIADRAAAIAETEQLDPRWRVEQIEADRLEIPDEQNSQRILGPLGATLEKLALSKMEQEDPQRPAFTDVEPNRLLTEADRALLRRLFAENEDLVQKALSVKEYPRGRAKLDWKPFGVAAPLPHIQQAREVVWLLGRELERRLDEKQPSLASDALVAMLNVGNSLGGEDLLIAQLVRIAIRSLAVQGVERTLGMTEPDEALLARWQALLAEQRKQMPARDGMRFERATAFRTLELLATGQEPMSRIQEAAGEQGKGASGWLVTWTLWEWSHHLPGEQAETLHWMNRIVKVANLPAGEQKAEWAALNADSLKTRREIRGFQRGLLTNLMVPAMVLVGESGTRDQALLAVGEVTLAAERYRRQNGRWPTTLEELVPRYLDSVPTDPFSGKRLVLKAHADGLVIYSVGKNGVDDGGLQVDTKHFLEPGSDYGLRLWNPDQRRLPAPGDE